MGWTNRFPILEGEVWEVEWIVDCLNKLVEILVWNTLHDRGEPAGY